MRTGKIARLPHPVREEINQRLHDGQPANSILDWLNNLPEVKEVLTLHFNGRPVAACNLTEWRNGGYHDWSLRQDALGIVDSLADETSLGDQQLADGFNDKIARWTSIHLASTARAVLANETDPKARLDLLHQLNSDVNRLRRNDLQAERLDIERHRLDLESQQARQKTDDEFWDWTKRPDIAKKLNPEKPKGITRSRLREIEQALCLTESDFDRQIMGRLMRQRRLTHEAAAILLAEKTAELDAAEPANSPKDVRAALSGNDSLDTDTEEESGDEARFAELCAERGLVLAPDDLSAEQSSSISQSSSSSCVTESSSPARHSAFDDGGSSSSNSEPSLLVASKRSEDGLVAPERSEGGPVGGSQSSSSSSSQSNPLTLNVERGTLNSTSGPGPSAGPNCELKPAAAEPSEPRAGDSLSDCGGEGQGEVAPIPAATDLCHHCHAPFPPLTQSNERPFPRCRSCGRPAPDPGEGLASLPDSPPPFKPHEHCPRCVAVLPPLRPDGARSDYWCASCGSPLPDPNSPVEHCPHCGGRVPEFNQKVPRSKADCVHCGRILPPIPLPPRAL